MKTYTRTIAEVPGAGRLGRHIGHDPRSLAYQVTPTATPVTTKHVRVAPILDQGDTGSCTGNAMTGALGTDDLYDSVNPLMVKAGYLWNESFARDVLYHTATTLDSYNGTFPPDDTGSDGLSVSKAAQKLGFISGYTHATSVSAMMAGLQSVAGIMGINWYDSFDGVGSDGVLSLPKTAKVRGGHEIHLLNVDMENERFELVNSWGESWAKSGHFFMSFDIATRLLSEDGDATFPVALTSPAPTPTPAPVDAVDAALIAALDPWEKSIVSRVTKSGKAKAAYDRWKQAKGY